MDHTKQLSDYFQNQGTRQTAIKGTTLIDDDAEPTAFYYLESGYVRVYSRKSRGEQYLHILYGAGDTFPLVWLANKVRNNVFFEALTDCVFYCVPIETINDALTTNTRLSNLLMQRAIEQYRIYTLRVDNLEYKYASERLAYRLVLLAERFGQAREGALVIEPPLTHQLLGNSINLSRESVSREMEKLLRKGLVRYNSHRQIVIPDVARLATRFSAIEPTKQAGGTVDAGGSS